MAPTAGERIASLERGLSDHERACEERLADIKKTVAGTEGKIDTLRGWIVAQLVAICGFCAVTLVAVVLRAAHLLG